IAALEASGELVPVAVDGWRGPLWLWHEARRPRRITARALLSPFDSLVFERARLQALFGVDYRIEICVSGERRQYGSCSYLLLWDGDLVARVGLTADRAAGVLRVRSAWREPTADPSRDDDVIGDQLCAELHTMASWLGLTDVEG